MGYIPGTYIDLSHIGKVRSPANIASKSPAETAYDYLFDFVEGHIVSRRKITVVFA